MMLGELPNLFARLEETGAAIWAIVVGFFAGLGIDLPGLLGGLFTGMLCLGLLAGGAGCGAGGLLSTVSADIKSMLESPAVQATLKDWAAKADITNPRISGVLLNGFELRLDGAIMRGETRGDALSLGIDPDRLERLMEIAEKWEAAQPPAEGGKVKANGGGSIDDG